MSGTVALPRRQPQPATSQGDGWRVLIFNDDVTPFDLVIFALQKAAGLSLEVAEMVAVEAHRSGSAVVRRGLERKAADQMAERIKAWTTIEDWCPGVQTKVEADT